MNTTNIEQKINKEYKYYFDKQETIIYNDKNYYYKVYLEYEKFLVERYFSIEYIYQCKRHIIYFLTFLEGKNIFNLKLIDTSIILNYINDYPSYYRKPTIENRNKHLRNILRFLYSKEYVEKDFSIFVPVIKISKYASIPSVWSKDNIPLIYIRDFLGHEHIETTEIYAKINNKIKDDTIKSNII